MKIHWKFWKKEETTFTSEQEEIIRKALEMNEMKELKYLMEQEELHGERTFSPEFEQKMKLLFHNGNLESEKEDTKKIYSFSNTPKTAMVTAFAVIVTVLFIGFQTEAIPVPKFIYKLQKDEGSYACLVEQEKFLKDSLEEKYDITEIPKGYKLQEILENKSLYRKIYRNEKGEDCKYQQFTKQSIVRVDEIIEDYKEMVINDSKFYILKRNNLNTILWHANGYQYTIQAGLSINELVKMAKSMVKK